ncbi:MAG TPA: FAD-dependent oxidoreductase [Candidatus Avidesulfovibrio excrementigallinarum]|nr:FAD-dependent oxidoreductase [Candidatus Avidesulfovibrio excrementigallinarum]
MDRNMDLIVIGAGPAGLSAACAARACGLDVTLIDEQAAPGGQLFRNIETPMAQAILDPKDRETGLALVKRFRNCGATYYPNTTVWGLEPHKVSCTINGKAEFLTASYIVIAPGGMERPVPFPGWTLPGVMGAGGADILLRSGGTLSADNNAPVVLAGNGPLLLLLAGHLLDAGVNIAAWLDTGTWGRRLQSGALMPAGLLDAKYMAKGIGMALRVLKGRVPIIRGVTNIRAAGTDHVEAVSYDAGGKTHEIAAQTLLRHEGIIPRTHILNSLGAQHAWDAVQRYWYPVTDEFGRTSIDGIYIAGDGTYVHGGDASLLKGTLAGIEIARRLGVITDAEAAYRCAPTLRTLRRTRVARGFLRYVFAPNPAIFNVPDDTMVCRCECVTAGDIRKAVSEGFRNVNEVKRFTRCGMGQCQGRMCGPALAELTAAAQAKSPAAVGTLQVRQPFRPVSLENYCNLNAPE